MEEKKKPEMDDEEQSARFIEAAEQIQEEDSWEKFEEAMKRILSAKTTKSAQKPTKTEEL